MACLLLPRRLSLCHSMSICHSLSPQSSPFLTCLSFSQAVLRNHLSVYQVPLLLFLFFSPPLVALWSIFVKSGSSRSPLFVCLWVTLPNREIGLHMWNEIQEADTHTHAMADTHFFSDAIRACLHSRAGLMKLLRQNLGRNSICWKDERSDRGKRGGWKDRRRKRRRVTAPRSTMILSSLSSLLRLSALLQWVEVRA